MSLQQIREAEHKSIAFHSLRGDEDGDYEIEDFASPRQYDLAIKEDEHLKPSAREEEDPMNPDLSVCLTEVEDADGIDQELSQMHSELRYLVKKLHKFAKW